VSILIKKYKFIKKNNKIIIIIIILKKRLKKKKKTKKGKGGRRGWRASNPSGLRLAYRPPLDLLEVARWRWPPPEVAGGSVRPPPVARVAIWPSLEGPPPGY